jgi:hypothetical protein
VHNSSSSKTEGNANSWFFNFPFKVVAVVVVVEVLGDAHGGGITRLHIVPS